MDSIVENINETELLKLMDCCRLCLSQTPSRVNLLTKERLGLSLLEMVNSLTGLHLSEFSNSLMVCLNCAGKIVNLHEFRDLCQVSDKKFSQMEMALRLKRMQNQNRVSKGVLDDDMQIFYVCKVCKDTFDDSKFEEYKEHKKQHVMNGEIHVQSNSVKQEGDKKKSGRKKRSVEIKEPSPESTSSKRQSRRSSVPKRSSDTNSETSKSTKTFECDVCDETFLNQKARYWHKVKVHGPTKTPSPTKKSHDTVKSPESTETKQYLCRYCDKTFEKRYSKYNHEKVCFTRNNLDVSHNDQSENDSEVIEQMMPVEPVVELTEDDVSNNGNETLNLDGTMRCYRCPEEFSSGRARSTHEKNVHNLSITECRICGKDFSTYANRYQHQRRCMLKNSITSENDDVNGRGGDDGDKSDLHLGFQAAFAQSL